MMIDFLKALRIAPATFFLLFASRSTAVACITAAPMDLRDVLLADVVISGVITSYEIIENPDRGRLSDYALIGMSRVSVLKGEIEEPILFTWDNSTFGEPEDLARPERGQGRVQYIAALRRAESPLPPLRGPSATILPIPDPGKLTVLQAPCSGAFLIPSDSPTGRAIEFLFKDDVDREAEADVLARFLGRDGVTGGLY